MDEVRWGPRQRERERYSYIMGVFILDQNSYHKALRDPVRGTKEQGVTDKESKRKRERERERKKKR